MADVFLSYARADREFAERLASAIEAAGKSVWWDKHIKGGSQFSKDIEQELLAARHVVVVWSAQSVESRWVCDEAGVAVERGNLIGTSIDGIMPPLGFRQFHTVALQEWCKTGGALPGELVDALGADLVAPTASAPVASASSKRAVIIAGAAIALALAGGAFVTTQGWPGSSAVQTSTASLAIMPFATLGGEDVAYLGPGLARTITTDLASLEGLQLIASGSSAALAGQGLTAQQIGERLGISHLVEGQITALGEELRADISIVDVASARQIWSQSYTGTTDRSQALHNEITQDLAAALQTRLDVGAGRVVIHGDVDPRAYEAYLRASEAQTNRFDVEVRREAYSHYRRAIEIDPDFAEAHAGLGYLLTLTPPEMFSLSREEHKAAYRSSIDRALSLDPSNLVARAAEVHAAIRLEGRARDALALSEQIVAEAPDSAMAPYARGMTLLVVGDYRGALQFLERARLVDPFNRSIVNIYGYALLANGDYQRISSYFQDCSECDQLIGLWFQALISLGSQDDFERDWPILLSRIGSGANPEFLRQVKSYIARMVAGEHPQLPRDLADDDYETLRLMAYGGEIEAALQGFSQILDSSSALQTSLLTHPGRQSLGAEIRADPRYHAAFDQPRMREVVEVRRENGRMEGLPVFPVKPYQGS